MKGNAKNLASRSYFQAFYANNHLNFTLALLCSLLSVPINLAVSWLLGELLDAASSGSMEQLTHAAKYVTAVCVSFIVLELSIHWTKSKFICRALEQYKSLAFRKLSEKSISAFSQENTGRYLSTLTNDVTAIETNYLENSFTIIEQTILFIGSLGMMLWYSPVLAAMAIALSILPIAVAVLTGGVLTKREQEVSEKNEGFMAQIRDLLNGFSVIKSFKAESEAQRQFDVASLDNQTAFAVTDAILHLDGLTRLVVTHRLDAALMEQYDEIVVLRDGQVREQGTFHQLMEEKGYFYSLFTLAA